ncbi:Receptor protein kinase-like protein ZAR1, partial [Linum grandiflorum]
WVSLCFPPANNDPHSKTFNFPTPQKKIRITNPPKSSDHHYSASANSAKIPIWSAMALFFFHLYFTYLFILSHSFPLSYSLNDEGIALLSFKQSLPNSALLNWNPSDDDPCSWDGILCKLGRVTSLVLPYKQQTGFFHLDPTNLTQLRHLNLRNNNLSGSFPPEFFRAASGLKTLVLSGNSFSGPIPEEIGNLKSLQSLDLSRNFFNGSFPLSLVNCNRLKQLILSSNGFSGSIPDGIGANLVMLTTLNLSFNSFNGGIPADLGNLSSLEGALDLSHNSFTGPIPSNLGMLPETVYIDLSYNNLSGPVPQTRTLLDAGPTAFVGNPLICGLPTKNPCSISLPEKPKPTADDDPSLEPGTRSRHGLLRNPCLVLVATVLGTLLGISLVALSFMFWYRKAHPGTKPGKKKIVDERSGSGIGKEMFCFRTDDLESLSGNIDQYAFLAMETDLGFDLEQLLKASAFLLGTSGVGIMYKVVMENRLTVAVRRLEDGGSQRFKEFQGEVEAIGKIRHRNIVSLLACCWCLSEKLLIYEFVPNGNLAAAIHGRNGVMNPKPMSWSVRLRILRGVAKGLVYLHECNPKRYVHGHLKPTSILLGEAMEPQIADFGLNRLACTTAEDSLESQLESRTPSQCSPYATTPVSFRSSKAWFEYEAPEVATRPASTKPSQKWDVYSYGVILLETVTGKSPMIMRATSGSEMDLARWVQLSLEVSKPVADIADPFLARDSDKEDQMAAVLKIGLACVNASPEKRPSIRNVSIALDKLAC